MSNPKVYVIPALFFADMLALFVSLTMGFGLRELINPVATTRFELIFDQNTISSFLTISFAVLIGFWVQQIYIKKLGFWEEMRVVIVSLVYTAAAVFFALAVAKIGYDVTRLGLVFSFFVAIIVLPISKQLVKTKLLNKNIFKEKIVILGNNENGQNTYKALARDSYLGYLPIGPIEYGKIKNIKRFTRLGVSSVAICDENLTSSDINKLQKYFKNIIFIPNSGKLASFNTEANFFFGEKLFFLSIKNNLQSKFNRSFKRLFDLFVSLLALPVLAVVVGVLAIAIKLDSKGAIFYKQARVGRGGRAIYVYKFRSMYQDAGERLKTILENDEDAKKEYEATFKLKNDPRITKVGEFLRKTSLDELPQIFNVIKGEMSLVGPRPVVQKEIDEYYRENAIYYHQVRPGITGLWQVSGRSDTDYDKRVALDNWYVLNWSIWLDVIILLKTFEVVLARKGAY
jgi:Undecaprenyl-phosphate galactose phosphotransferase WbaP